MSTTQFLVHAPGAGLSTADLESYSDLYDVYIFYDLLGGASDFRGGRVLPGGRLKFIPRYADAPVTMEGQQLPVYSWEEFLTERPQP